MGNLLLEPVEYAWEENAWGTWRRYMYPTGQVFAEFQSNAVLPNGWPLIHITWGRCPETGRRKVARGGLAIGRMAVGVVALGHLSAGLVSLGQASLGVVLGIGQATCGLLALGQFAGGVLAGLGQMTSGVVAIGQLGAGVYVLAQEGFGTHVLSTTLQDPAAVEFFRPLLELLGLAPL